jgi:hypothetical protein
LTARSGSATATETKKHGRRKSQWRSRHCSPEDEEGRGRTRRPEGGRAQHPRGRRQSWLRRGGARLARTQRGSRHVHHRACLLIPVRGLLKRGHRQGAGHPGQTLAGGEFLRAHQQGLGDRAQCTLGMAAGPNRRQHRGPQRRGRSMQRLRMHSWPWRKVTASSLRATARA